ncbi:hypothetical protein Solca_1480 [Solitalea canadensis DSM 3403]|uniref:Uncharacterized protein n=1 Tax=Solitalea canadensis (strain ATCC 29591 / DSM 3403 / JCM 21819 / LMG 8368 / NBRC 15130 / NCIMB 12057 / USAM 9D) TaxID=929556 RepID=H8KQE1_SOLCM|nr:hypothetical protein Solca_1480 [Solitalea canadensis DSM 3403]
MNKNALRVFSKNLKEVGNPSVIKENLAKAYLG